ncbi:MAG TPA: type VI secretion system tip protein TssI/VgrG [Planctomycetota bacterium]|nr:type VI secretion system tip protein TssI/VgrG [Planctomycetota bacterium]
MAPENKAIEFESKAPKAPELLVETLTGREEISRPFEFTVDLLSRDKSAKLEEFVRNPASVSIKVPISGSDGKRRMKTAKIHGVLSTFEQLDQLHDWTRYRAVLVPKLWRLSLSVQTRLFLEKNVQEIVTEVLEAQVGGGGQRLTSDDFEFRLKGSPTVRKYVVQYQETDLDFVHRMLEYWGIYYFFEHKEDGSKVIFANDPSKYPEIAEKPKLPYRPNTEGRSRAAGAADAESMTEEAVISFVAKQNGVSAQVTLQDYYDGTPTANMKVSQTVEEGDEGEVYRFGEHYLDEGEGGQIAEIRAQEIQCRQRIFDIRTDCRSMRAGIKFPMVKHYRDSFNSDYLAVVVRHKAKQELSGNGDPTGKLEYENTVTAIPAAFSFRPERRIPWPRISGVFNAKVDSGGRYAEIDDQGRYKLKFPMDLEDRGEGKGSPDIRLGEPYAGPDYGDHQPLHKDCEVLVSHENGDPDRPVIVAAVPNPDNASPVKNSNQTQSIIRTAANNQLVMEDEEGEEWIHLSTPNGTTFIDMGADHNHITHAHAGIVAGTEGGISLNAGKSVHISAGTPTGDGGVEQGAALMNKIQSYTAAAVTALSVASAAAGERVATGHSNWAGLAADLAGAAAGFAGMALNTNCYMSSPTKVAVLGGGEVMMAAGAALDCVAAGQATFASLVSTLVGCVNTLSLISGRHAELISIAGNVTIEAKKVGNVKVEAKKNVVVEAKTEDIKMEAKRDFHLKTEEGKGVMEFHKDLTIESKEDKKIILKAGESSITMEDSQIVIRAKKIQLQSQDDKNTVTLVNGGDATYDLEFKTKGAITMDAEDNIEVYTDKLYSVMAEDTVEFKCKKLDEKACDAIERANSKEG